MSEYVWGFEISTYPEPPAAINQGSPPPPDEDLGTAKVTVIDKDAEGYDDALKSIKRSSHIYDTGDYDKVTKLLDDGIINTSDPAWVWWINMNSGMGELPTTDSSVRGWAKWEQIYSGRNTGGEGKYSQSHTIGVTNTESETKTFEKSMGLSVSVGYGPVSATLSVEYKESVSNTVSIELSESTTTTVEYDLPADSYTQIWQLVTGFDSDRYPSGTMVEKQNIFQCLTTTEKGTVKGNRR